MFTAGDVTTLLGRYQFDKATQAIREIEAGPNEHGHVTIVGVTAHALTGDKETCFDAGMDDYLPKPVSMDSLKSMLDKYLGGSDQSASLSA